MFVLAEDKVFESSTDARSILRKIAKPRQVLLGEFPDGAVAVGATDAIDTAGLEAAMNIPKVTFHIGQVLNHVMRVNSLNGGVEKWKLIS